MTLLSLQATNFRCLQAVEMSLDPVFTFISGPNASGKTSILEAIYVLGRGRSFRSRVHDPLINQNAERFVVFGDVLSRDRPFGMGIESGATGVRARIDGHPAKALSELAIALPVQVIDPEVHKLIEEAPTRRRRFIDWGVFHVEPQFGFHWHRYQQALRQRNAALRSRSPRSLVTAWDSEFVASGTFVSQARELYVSRLSRAIDSLSTALLGEPVEIRYRSGWNRELSLNDALQANWANDRDRGATQVGPQRADLVVEFQGRKAREWVSRGQQKMLASALLLAQLELFSGLGATPTLLLDDPAAELDALYLGRLIEAVRTLPVQLIVTSLQADFAAFGMPGVRYSIDGAHYLSQAL